MIEYQRQQINALINELRFGFRKNEFCGPETFLPAQGKFLYRDEAVKIGF